MEGEAAFLENMLHSHRSIMLAARADGKIVALANFFSNQKPRLSHRGEIGITVLKDYWGKKIGTGI